MEMASERDESKQASGAKELLFQDFRYLSEAFWKYEQAGETRVNWFIGITTAVIGGLVTLTTQQYGRKGPQLRLVIIGGLLALFVFGLVTLFRLATRNKNTDMCKRGLDAIRQSIKDHFDPDGTLVNYYPIDLPELVESDLSEQVESRKTWWRAWWSMCTGISLYSNERQFRKFGGLSHSVAAINSVIWAGIVGVLVFRAPKVCDAPRACIENPVVIVVCSFVTAVVAFALQDAYIRWREFKNKEELREGRFTHAFGVVYQLQLNGVAQYLLVRPKHNKEGWVLPKGHVKPGEGHGEAALREVREEAGVAGRLVGFIGVVDEYEAPNTKDHVKGKAYLMELLHKDGSAEEENRQPRWFTFEDAKGNASYPETKYLLDAAERKRLELAKARESAKPNHEPPASG
jgi:ADP-ribose pyrophosphatase YjhB (NUDIX family)